MFLFNNYETLNIDSDRYPPASNSSKLKTPLREEGVMFSACAPVVAKRTSIGHSASNAAVAK